MIVPVVLAALMFWACVFMVVFTIQGTTLLEFLFGRYEPLPDDLGHWKETAGHGREGLLREERSLLPQGRARSGYLLHQVRYRDPVTQVIVRVEPEQRRRRHRIGRRSSR